MSSDRQPLLPEQSTEKEGICNICFREAYGYRDYIQDTVINNVFVSYNIPGTLMESSVLHPARFDQIFTKPFVLHLFQ